MKVSEIVTESLQSYGVKRVYGLIGTSIIDIVDSLKETSIRYISTRHEYGAVSMADGEARTTCFPGVALVHGGPGFLNSLTGIANSYKDSSPLLVVSGAVKRRLWQTNSWLEVNQIDIAKNITKKSFRLATQNDAPSFIANAFSCAISDPKGPVLLEIPEDVLKADTYGSVLPFERKSPPEVTEDDLNKIISLLSNSERPLLLAGGGINNMEGSQELSEFVKETGIPVVTTGNGRGTLSEEEELCLGRVGFGGGNIVADTAFKNSDVIIAIGAGISDITTYGYNVTPLAKVVSVELDEGWRNKPVTYDLHIEADGVSFLRILRSKMKGFNPRTRWLEQIKDISKRLESQVNNYLETRKRGYVNAGLFLKKLDESVVDYILALGQGFHTLYGYVFMKVRKPRSFLAATNMGSMGFALPASMGAKLANKERDVVCVIGDGEFMMSLAELETAVRERIGIKVVVMNDNSYRVLLIRQVIQKMGRIHGTIHTNPDLLKLGEAFGFRAMKVDSNELIDEGLKFLREKSDIPSVLELTVDKEDIPPFNVDASLLF